MMRYMVIDSDKDLREMHETECSTPEEAINEAQRVWGRLTIPERKQRIVTAGIVEDDYGTIVNGCVKCDIVLTLWEGWL